MTPILLSAILCSTEPAADVASGRPKAVAIDAANRQYGYGACGSYKGRAVQLGEPRTVKAADGLLYSVTGWRFASGRPGTAYRAEATVAVSSGEAHI